MLNKLIVGVFPHFNVHLRIAAILLYCTASFGAQASKNPATASSNQTFGEWFAAGSGCRATHKSPGNVTFTALSGSGSAAAEENIIRGKFNLKDYSLVSPPENIKTSIAFARECSLRIQVTPPANRRVKSVSARSVLVASKEGPVKLQVQNTLHMDTTMVGGWLTEFQQGEVIANRDFEVILNPGTWRGIEQRPIEIPKYACGKMMVFGSDLTIIAHRKNKADKASVVIGGDDRSLEFAVELEDCKD